MAEEIEVEFEDARRGIKFRVKGATSTVDKYLEKYGYETAIKESVSKPKQTASTTESPVQTEAQAEELAIPEKPQAETLSQYLLALLHSEWGERGRTSSEMLKVAEAHGITMQMSTLAGILHRLTVTNKVRRKREAGEGQWKYFPSLSYSFQR